MKICLQWNERHPKSSYLIWMLFQIHISKHNRHCGGGSFKRWLSYDSRALMNEISDFIKGTERISFCPSNPSFLCWHSNVAPEDATTYQPFWCLGTWFTDTRIERNKFLLLMNFLVCGNLLNSTWHKYKPKARF